jgi:deoxyinosine 3'endonuclease (endonuclease V)
MDQIERLLKHAVDGCACTVVQNPAVRKPVKPETLAKQKAKKETDIKMIRTIADELGVRKKNREDKLVVIRTSLVYYLLNHFNALTISQAFGWNHTTVRACKERYESLKHYADYGEASATVIQCLKRYSLADYPRATL